mgnify:CR=1 FL=1
MQRYRGINPLFSEDARQTVLQARAAERAAERVESAAERRIKKRRAVAEASAKARFPTDALIQRLLVEESEARHRP